MDWKVNADGSKSLLIEGAGRIGRSTIIEEFARKEYKSFIIIDFNISSSSIKNAFIDYMNDLNTFFMILDHTLFYEHYQIPKIND